ncbi:mannose-1-phosphate guanylyltransferase [Aquirufa ecclesiirivi]|uniref:mannose-1-phosphate guanylyltransferase n=1 Tax=Aquirufa ecclesiirivi TaxID=2715124 RepID=UPI0022A8D1C0|nr:sugar phosphate nucleotidyltransferase [Aquirufa ecclesiirivi]MCZ2471771.1 mannose-1-phosphate guanylyltransferase [Aquirufa ecclesiirivi]MDF0693484.1 sugar phosphate nucleotidyltransferase [Aquirufa ecclesiirivi]
MKDNYLIIMAGGIGTRFWPISRSANPKQFHDVLGVGKTMLQQTAERFQGIIPQENIYVVTSDEFAGLVEEQLPFLSKEQILKEPQRKNTAPCIAYATYKIAKKNKKAKFVVAPADHVILKENAFQENIRTALEVAEEGVFVTLGIIPTRPDTGYGYIQYVPNDNKAQKVKTFTEKPNLELAQAFLESGDYVWNAGIFVFKLPTFKKELEKHQSRMAEQFEEGLAHYYTQEEESFIKKVYAVCKNISMDVGIMEKAQEVKVILSDIGWSDLGTWQSLYEINEKDANNNVVEGNVITYDTQNCIIKTPAEKLVIIQGLKGFIVAEHGNALMICPKDQEQEVKKFVEEATALDPKFS